MCRSDSAADTRDSENTFPASLADEKKREEQGKPYRGRKETKTSAGDTEKKV